MKVKPKILLSFLSAIFFSLFCLASLAQDNAPVTLQINNNTKQYYVYLTDINFSPGSYTAYNFVNKGKSGLNPGSSGSIIIQPDNGALEGAVIFIIGTTTSSHGGAFMQLGFNFSDHQLFSLIINGNPGLEDKVTIAIQGETSKWTPGQNIKVNISDILP